MSDSTPAQPGTFDQIVAQIGQYSGLGTMIGSFVNSTYQHAMNASNLLWQQYRIAVPASSLVAPGTQSAKFAIGQFMSAQHGFLPSINQFLGGIGVGLSAYSAFKTFQGMLSGQVSLGSGLLNLGMSTIGMATGINMLVGSGTMFGFSGGTAAMGLAGPAGWIAAAGILAITFVVAMIWGIHPSQAEETMADYVKGLKNTPLPAWTAVTAMVVATSGLAFLNQIHAKVGASSPLSQTMTVSTDDLVKAFQAGDMRDADGNPITDLSQITSSTVVAKGTGPKGQDQFLKITMTAPDTFVIEMDTVDNGSEIAITKRPPENGYIELFLPAGNGRWRKNPDALTAQNKQMDLLQQAAESDSPLEVGQLVHAALATNKY